MNAVRAWITAGLLATAAGAEDGAKPVAYVNDVPITRAELEGAFRQSRSSDRATQMPAADVERLKTRVLQLLVNRELLNQHLTQHGVKVDEKLVAEHVAQVQERLTANGQTLAGFLQKLGVTEEQMRSDIRSDYRWLAYVESQAKESVLRKYFNDNREAFDGSQARVRHILIKAADGVPKEQKELARRRATDLRARIAEGEAFDSLAKQYSDCPSRDKGGELPWFPRKGVMSEAFSQAAFSLKANELSQVVDTEFGSHLIVLLEKKPGPKEAVFEDVVDDVKTFYAEDLRRATVARLRDKARIKLLFPKPADR